MVGSSLVLVLENIVQLLFARLKGIFILMCLGWYELNTRFCLESMGLRFLHEDVEELELLMTPLYRKLNVYVMSIYKCLQFFNLLYTFMRKK